MNYIIYEVLGTATITASQRERLNTTGRALRSLFLVPRTESCGNRLHCGTTKGWSYGSSFI